MSDSRTVLPAPELLDLTSVRVTESTITLVAGTSLFDQHHAEGLTVLYSMGRSMRRIAASIPARAICLRLNLDSNSQNTQSICFGGGPERGEDLSLHPNNLETSMS